MLYKCKGLNSCAQSMMLRVREKAKWICDKKSNDKVVIISSKLSDLGEVIDIKVKSSSDDKEFDLAAIQAVKNSAPFRELGSLSAEELIKAKNINFKFVGNKD
jgi:TonB family protein